MYQCDGAALKVSDLRRRTPICNLLHFFLGNILVTTTTKFSLKVLRYKTVAETQKNVRNSSHHYFSKGASFFEILHFVVQPLDHILPWINPSVLVGPRHPVNWRSENLDTEKKIEKISIPQKVLQYTSNMYCNTPPTYIAVLLVPHTLRKGILPVLLPFVPQYASHEYCNAPPIYAIFVKTSILWLHLTSSRWHHHRGSRLHQKKKGRCSNIKSEPCPQRLQPSQSSTSDNDNDRHRQ